MDASSRQAIGGFFCWIDPGQNKIIAILLTRFVFVREASNPLMAGTFPIHASADRPDS
jgi:hypothetical protein